MKRWKFSIKTLLMVLVLLIIITSIFLYVISKPNNKDIDDKKLISDMKSYYEKYLKDKVIGATRHQVALEMLEKTGYNVDDYKDCDLKKSYLNIIPNKDGSITVENHLSCKK
jgi:hypothetical protein